jgi:hypothetical protein
MTARIALGVAAMVLYIQCQTARAQRATSPVRPYLGDFVDDHGNPVTDPTTPLYKKVADSLVPVLGSNSEHWTLDDIGRAAGNIDIAARPGGGTDMIVQLEGLIPNERYSVWGSYFVPPGFPNGERVAFGAVSERGDGSESVANADANGRISLSLVQLAGPMTFFGSAPSYARMSPVFDANGAPRVHTGYGVGIAYHFPNAPEPPYPTPGPADTWALVATARFAPIPEPSSIVLFFLAMVASGVCVLRRRQYQATLIRCTS